MIRLVPTILVATALVAGCSSDAARSGLANTGAAANPRAHYQCDGAKTIDAFFTAGDVVPGNPPRPTGKVTIALGYGRTLTLPQTLSASGVRYANADESFVFWIKGDGALVLEHNQEKTYIGCVRVADDPGGLPGVFASGQEGFSLRYPAGFEVVADHVYQALGPGHDIHGVALRIDPALARGTNLAPDSYVAVERLLGDDDNCAAARFLDHAAPATVVTDSGVTYSYAQATGAGAGNRYEEHVYTIPGTSPCLAVRYFIHFTLLENYPEGTVRAFDHDALLATFDAMRRSLGAGALGRAGAPGGLFLAADPHGGPAGIGGTRALRFPARGCIQYPLHARPRRPDPPLPPAPRASQDPPCSEYSLPSGVTRGEPGKTSSSRTSPCASNPRPQRPTRNRHSRPIGYSGSYYGRWWADWRRPLRLVKPETVIAWHRKDGALVA